MNSYKINEIVMKSIKLLVTMILNMILLIWHRFEF